MLKNRKVCVGNLGFLTITHNKIIICVYYFYNGVKEGKQWRYFENI